METPGLLFVGTQTGPTVFVPNGRKLIHLNLFRYTQIHSAMITTTSGGALCTQGCVCVCKIHSGSPLTSLRAALAMSRLESFFYRVKASGF